MKQLAPVAALALAFALAGCGHHDQASDDATANSVEMPAADLPAGPPSLPAPPPRDPAADASAAAEAARADASTAADNAVSAAEAAKAAAAEAEQQGGASNQTTAPAQ